MIEPRELRENNLYKVKENTYKCVGHYYDHGQKYVELIEIDEEDFNMFKARHISKLKPIPLTEEILLKCGFENWGTVNFNQYECYVRYVLYNYVEGTSNYEVHIYGGTIIETKRIEYSIDNDDTQQIKHTSYLHNLQNAVIQATGKELEIKL